MANVTRVTPVEIQTSIGPYRTAILDIDAPLSNTYPSIYLNLGLLYNITIDYFYRNGVGPNFTIGDKFAFEHNGNSCKITQNGVETSVSTTGLLRIGYILRGTDEGVAMAEMNYPVGNSVVTSSALLNLDFWSFTPPTSASFGTMTGAYSGSSGSTLNIGYNFEVGKFWAEYLLDHQPVTYNWTVWDQISGNGGQYRCNLTKIKDDSIGDFSGIIYGDSDDMDRISSQADLMSIFHNMSYDTERIIAWSGANWVSLTLHTVSGLPNQVEFYFKFYIPGISSTVPIVSLSFNIVWNGEFRAQAFYMSFVHDDEEQAALFAPVEKTYDGQFKWGYNASALTYDDMLYLWLWLQASGSPQGDSPYSTGTTDNGGEPGAGMPQSHIDVPSAPQLGGTATGMFTVYCPTEAQMRKIAAFLWSADTIDNIRKYFNNFAENIIAFYALPCKPSNNPTKIFTVGNLASDDTDLQSVEYISNRFLQIDMGDLIITPFWDSYLDYAPYSKMEIYLPGIGVQPVDVDDIMCPALEDGSLPASKGSRLHIDYTVDLMTGVLVAFLSINGEMRYQFPGKIGYSIPLTGENYFRLVQGYVTATAGLIGTIATGGAAAPFAAGAAAAGIINAMKPDIYRGGNLSGDASMLSRKTPMLIYRRPNKPQLDNQEEFTGFPSYKIGLLSEFSGYTEVIDAHVEGISCTDEERELILNALKEGVII